MTPNVKALSTNAIWSPPVARIHPAIPADDPSEVVEGRPGAVRRPELALIANEAREQRAEGRIEEWCEAGGEDRDRRDRPDRTVDGDEDRQDDHADRPHDVGDEQDIATIEPIADDARRDRKEDVRQEARCPDERGARGSRSPR